MRGHRWSDRDRGDGALRQQREQDPEDPVGRCVRMSIGRVWLIRRLSLTDRMGMDSVDSFSKLSGLRCSGQDRHNPKAREECSVRDLADQSAARFDPNRFQVYTRLASPPGTRKQRISHDNKPHYRRTAISTCVDRPLCSPRNARASSRTACRNVTTAGWADCGDQEGRQFRPQERRRAERREIDPGQNSRVDIMAETGLFSTASRTFAGSATHTARQGHGPWNGVDAR